MPMASAVETPNLMNTLDKDKFVNAVSNNASTDKNLALSKEEIAKLQKWLQDKNITNENGLKLGDTGDQVTKLQTWLTENNFYNGEIDGNFGADTETAVKAFQKEVGLKEDGQVGDYTLLAMEQWDEYAEAATSTVSASSSSSSSSNKVYSSASKSKTYQSKKVSAKKTNSKTRYSNNRRGYINGMDCWAMSAYLSSKLSSQGYSVRTLQYATSMSSRHRSVQIYQNGAWVNAPQYSSLPKIYSPTI
jgi:N-acetylmuramoyl-L-alanine amidase